MSTVALPKGAWLPDRNGVLHFHRDQPAPTWQQQGGSVRPCRAAELGLCEEGRVSEFRLVLSGIEVRSTPTLCRLIGYARGTTKDGPAGASTPVPRASTSTPDEGKCQP